MLKGLKKKPAQKDSQATLNPVQKQQPQNKDPSISNNLNIKIPSSELEKSKRSFPFLQQQLKDLNSSAFDLLLDGKVIDLKAKLEYIRMKQSEYFSNQRFLIPQLDKIQGAGEKEKSKFSYEMDFNEEQEQQGRKRKKHIPRVKADRKVDYCQYCPENQQLYLLSASNYVYVAFPKIKTFRKYLHLIIAPVQHQQTRIGLDTDIQEEIKNYQKCLIQMFQKINLHAIFLEQYSSQNSHIYIECLGIPLKKAYDLPFFFKQALENVEGSWTSHKNIIDIRKEKGGILKQIPKQIKYCYIDFGLGYGYAHVIENQKFWDRGFLYQVIASALGLESYHVKTTEEYVMEQLQLKAKEFDKIWKDFNWTNLLDK